MRAGVASRGNKVFPSVLPTYQIATNDELIGFICVPYFLLSSLSVNFIHLRQLYTFSILLQCTRRRFVCFPPLFFCFSATERSLGNKKSAVRIEGLRIK